FALCAARQRARPRGGASREFGLFPRSGRPDAARGAVKRSLLAAAGGGPRLRRGASVDRCIRAQGSAPLRAGVDAFGGAADLRGGAGGAGSPDRRAVAAAAEAPR